jgi:hypothetical protein
VLKFKRKFRRLKVNKLGEWAVEYGRKINSGKSKAGSFTKARTKE